MGRTESSDAHLYNRAVTHGFAVYIDESGDEGFQFARGSSDWLVLAAVIVEREHDLATVRLVEDVRALLGRPGRALHFRDLKHEQRVPYVHRIGAARLRTVSVLVHKPSIAEPGAYQRQPHALYFHATRLLLERVSWCCARSNESASARGLARLVFSNRSNMSYDELRGSLRQLRSGAIPGVRVRWDALDCDGLQALPHHARMGLQIADAVASSMWCGVNRNRFGHVEPRYAKELAGVVYRHESAALGFGIELFPRGLHELASELPELDWIGPTYEPRPSRA